MTPKLSPGKTWEGFSGGILFTILAGIGMHALTDSFSSTAWAIMGLLIALLAFSGDLFESSLKRRFGLKDTGRMLPGHGGILDRFDSLLFVTPALVIILLIINFVS
jgi:phosphatidate cytidylyltransferase